MTEEDDENQKIYQDLLNAIDKVYNEISPDEYTMLSALCAYVSYMCSLFEDEKFASEVAKANIDGLLKKLNQNASGEMNRK